MIEGHSKRHFFRGWHEGLADDAPVGAKWGELDGEYVGVWVEDGQDYLFRFTLPQLPPGDDSLSLGGK